MSEGWTVCVSITTNLLHYHPGLSKYGWEAHDGKSFGRQELHDNPFHLTTSWVKHQCSGCGYGGDWALLLDVKQHPASASATKQDLADAGSKAKRISVVFYIADERNLPVDIAAADLRQQGSGESRLIFQAASADAGDYQLHAGSPSELALAICTAVVS